MRLFQRHRLTNVGEDSVSCVAATQIEYDEVKDAMLSQGGIEPGHLAVPGPDGKLGFSGMCLPKDIRAMIKYQEWFGLFPNVLEAAEETNQSVRPHDSLCRELA